MTEIRRKRKVEVEWSEEKTLKDDLNRKP